MSLIFATIPPKRLAQGITSASTTFYINNILGFDGLNNVIAANLGTQHYCVFRNDTGSRIEIMEIDPSTISSGPITIVRRGLSYYGDRTTEDSNLKFDWSANETIVQLGTDAPQIFQYLKEYIDAAVIAGVVPASTSAAGIVVEATQAQVDARTTTTTISGTPYKNFAPLDKIRASKYHDYVADAGSTDAYAITVVPAITAYSAGQIFAFKANTVNTDAATLNVCGLGAKTIKKNYATDLATGDIVANQIVTVVYDGTNFQLISPAATTTTSISQAFTSSGTWTKPAGAKSISVTLIGAGGGGGLAGGINNYGGGGGGGGAINSSQIPADLITPTVSVTVSSSTATNADGVNTTFGSYLTAIGGKLGGPGINANGGTGGVGGTASGNGIAGGAGGTIPASIAAGGGGGAGGGTSSNANVSTAGIAGTSFASLGAGGTGTAGAGNSYGGGGAGNGTGAGGYAIITTYF